MSSVDNAVPAHNLKSKLTITSGIVPIGPDKDIHEHVADGATFAAVDAAVEVDGKGVIAEAIVVGKASITIAKGNDTVDNVVNHYIHIPIPKGGAGAE